MYTRMETCTLAGLDIDNFKALAHRDQLPIMQSKAGSRRSDGYSAYDVLVIASGHALSIRAGYERGLQPSTAMPIAAAARDWIQQAFAYPSGQPDIWVGTIAARVSSFDAGKAKAGWYVGGTLANVATEIEKQSARIDNGVFRVFLVNVSDVVREVRGRARRAKIFFPSDASEAA